MKLLYTIISLCFCLLTLAGMGNSQELPRIIISEIKEIERIPVPHLGLYLDREIIFNLSNSTEQKMVVYGTYLEGKLAPIHYRLMFNKKTNIWEYPPYNKKPIPWKKVSWLKKDEKILNPGESLTFSTFESNVQNCGELYKVTVWVKIGKSKKPQEIISEEFATDPCK